MPDNKPDIDHDWVIPALIHADRRMISQARQRNYITVSERTRIDVIDLYCCNCRRPYDEVRGTPCPSKTSDNGHLRGGPLGERAKRKHRHDCFAEGCETAAVVAARQRAAGGRA